MSEPIELNRQADGRLGLRQNDEIHTVNVTRCFPWTKPNAHLSLRNDKGDEVAYIRDLLELQTESRLILEEELRLTGQTFKIIGIDSVQKEIELRCWEVRTQGGERHFQTELDEWPRQLPDGSLLIQDLFGDLYRITDPKALDPSSLKILLPLLG